MLVSLLLLMALQPSRGTPPCRSQNCGVPLQQSLKLTRLIHKESVELIRTYVSPVGAMLLLLLLFALGLRLEVA